MPQSPFSHIAVLGAGAWGTALALARTCRRPQTTLWVRETDVLASCATAARTVSCPGVTLPTDLTVTGDLAQAAQADALLLVVPAQVLHGFADSLRALIAPGKPLVICAKGIEKGTGKAGDRSAGARQPPKRGRHPVGSELCARRGARTAHRRHHRRKGELAAQLQAALGSATFAPMPATT